MKTTMRPLLLVLLLATALTSCKKELDIKAPGKYFSLDQFEKNIKAFIADSSVGYSYSISYKGNQVRSGAGGFAVAPWDIAGGIPHKSDKRQDLASCSKTITALTLLSIMQEKGIKLEDSLINYIPKKAWNIPQAFTFRQNTLKNLFRHETGFPAGGIDYNSLKSFAEAGGIFLWGNYAYQNQNYAFLRIVIAYATHRTQLEAIENSAAGIDHSKLDDMINTYYIQEVNARVFAKSGIPYTLPTPAGETNPTMNYNFYTQAAGWNKGDMTKFVGSAGWRLSAKEQNAIMAHLKYTNDILNDTWKTRMNDNLLGWSLDRSKVVTGGMAYMHGGYFEDKFSPNQSANPAGRGCYTVHVIFPNDYEAAVQVNSLGGTPTMEGTVTNSYEAAWIE